MSMKNDKNLWLHSEEVFIKPEIPKIYTEYDLVMALPTLGKSALANRVNSIVDFDKIVEQTVSWDVINGLTIEDPLRRQFFDYLFGLSLDVIKRKGLTLMQWGDDWRHYHISGIKVLLVRCSFGRYLKGWEWRKEEKYCPTPDQLKVSWRYFEELVDSTRLKHKDADILWLSDDGFLLEPLGGQATPSVDTGRSLGTNSNLGFDFLACLTEEDRKSLLSLCDECKERNNQ